MAADKKKTTATGVATLIVMFGILVIFFAVSGDDNSNIEQWGYFRSEDRHRVMSYRAPEGATEAEVRKLFKQLPWTAGKPTWAVIYEGQARAPGAILTQAGDTTSALPLIFGEPYDRWTWRMDIYPSGDRFLSRQNCPDENDVPCGDLTEIFRSSMENPS